MLKIFAKNRAKKDASSPKSSNRSLSSSSLSTDSESSLDANTLQQTVNDEETTTTTTTVEPMTSEIEIGESDDQNTGAESPTPPPGMMAEPGTEQMATEANFEETAPPTTTTTTATEPPPPESETEAKTSTPETATLSTTVRPGIRYIRRNRVSTIGTTPEPQDSYEYQIKMEREEAMIRVWQRSTIPKKLPFPSRYPDYLKEPPELSYEDTSSSMQRKIYNDARIKTMREEPFKRDESRVIHVSPRMNRTVELRSRYIRREPLVNSYFSQHYNLHKKPPFRNINVKFYN